MLEKIVFSYSRNGQPPYPGIEVHSPSAEEGIVAVSDTGVGIDPKILPYLFDHNIKTTNFGTAGEHGTGLGLPYCADLLHAHGGTIRADSEPGKGSTFTIHLPFSHPTILVVDDDEVACAVINALLAPIRCKIIMAGDGLDALEKVISTPPHLIICDIKMPRMDGYGLLGELKKDGKLGGIPVILMTGNILEKKEKALAAGAVDLFVKPPDGDRLLASVRHLLGDILAE